MMNARTILRFFLFSTVLFGLSPALAQTLKRNCGTVDHMNHLMESHPNMRQSLRRIDNHRSMVAKGSLSAVPGKIRIPVVVHVVYNTAEQNISDQQVISQIKVLNQDYQRKNPDRFNTPQEFASVAASADIEFRLATRDPDDNPTNGIIRRQSDKSAFYTTTNNIKYQNMGGSDAWPSDEYLNIWVGPLGMGVLGYAQFPGGPAETDGVVINYKAFGTQGTVVAPFTLGRTATHEVGHWLNLKHISGDGPCGVDDGVEDTPPTDRQHYGCMEGYSSCGNLDMVSNYMDYSDDGCMNLFTQGQSERMRSLFAPGGFRHAILSSRGLEATLPVVTITPPVEVQVSSIGSNHARIDWPGLDGVRAYLVRLRRKGNDRWVSRQFDRNFVNAGKLRSCSEYEIQVASVVGDKVSDFSSSFLFQTEGCLDRGYRDPMEHGPSNIRVTHLTAHSAQIDWEDAEEATDYKLQYKVAGAKEVYSRRVDMNSVTLSKLSHGKRYLFRLRANKGDQRGAYSEVSSFILPSASLASANLRTSTSEMIPSENFVEAYPKPEQRKVELSFSITEEQPVKVWVEDIRQKTIVPQKIYQVSPGQALEIDLDKFPRERYYLEIEESGGFMHQIYIDLR